MASLVGSRVERKEDKRFLTGKGRYTADINILKSNKKKSNNKNIRSLNI